MTGADVTASRGGAIASDDQGRPKVLVAAYAISAHHGSEFGVAWNYVVRLGRDFDLTVLYGTAGGPMGSPDDQLERLAAEAGARIRFVHVPPGMLARTLDRLNHAVSGLFFTFAYRCWQHDLYGVARELVRCENYAVSHQLGTINYRHPGSLPRLGLAHVWGPI